jgi:hypothetical protein
LPQCQSQPPAAVPPGERDCAAHFGQLPVPRRREVESIDREAGQIALRQADLQRRFGLTASVPCAGMDNLSGNTGRKIGTLFCDEADGPLDPERKRMFMNMKRGVLRLGGYACEFFVSQTPVLTSMADRIIDVEGMVTEAAEEAA